MKGKTEDFAVFSFFIFSSFINDKNRENITKILIIKINNSAAESVVIVAFFLFFQKTLRDKKFDDGAGIVAREFVGK